MRFPVQAIFASDFHLNGYSTLFPEQDDADDFVFNVLEQIMQYARDNGVKNIIIPGDVFDCPEPTDDAKMKLMQFFRKHHIFSFWIIPGNHDYSHEGLLSLKMFDFLTSELHMFQNVRYFLEPSHVSVEGVPFTFLPWPHSKVDVAEPHFVVAHIEIAGAKWPGGRPMKKNSFEAPPEHKWFVGHIHELQTVGKNVMFTGNILQKNFSENTNKGFVHATFTQVGTRWRCQTKFVPVHTPFELHTVVANDHDELTAIQFQPDTRAKIHRYRLQYHKDIVLPPTWLARHPQIIKPEPFSSTTQLNYDVVANEAATTTELDLPGDLDAWLIERQATEEDRGKARHLLQDIMTGLGITTA